MSWPYLEIIPTCVQCDACQLICPEQAILVYEKNYAVETWSCTLCQLCLHVCPVDAIKTRERDIFDHQEQLLKEIRELN